MRVNERCLLLPLLSLLHRFRVVVAVLIAKVLIIIKLVLSVRFAFHAIRRRMPAGLSTVLPVPAGNLLEVLRLVFLLCLLQSRLLLRLPLRFLQLIWKLWLLGLSKLGLLQS
jgi:hypothetical protein